MFSAVVGALLVRLRVDRKVTQGNLAVMAHVSQSSLSRFENGQSLPDLHEMWAIADALDVAPTVLSSLIDHALTRAGELAKLLPRGRRSGEEISATATLAVAAIRIPKAA